MKRNDPFLPAFLMNAIGEIPPLLKNNNCILYAKWHNAYNHLISL